MAHPRFEPAQQRPISSRAPSRHRGLCGMPAIDVGCRSVRHASAIFGVASPRQLQNIVEANSHGATMRTARPAILVAFLLDALALAAFDPILPWGRARTVASGSDGAVPDAH